MSNVFAFNDAEASTTGLHPRLQVKSLSFRYRLGRSDVLQGVNLSVAPGQAVGVLGPNGAGKTTLLGCIVGALKGRRTGMVTVDGFRDFQPRWIGFATQDVALYPMLTVRENIRHMANLTLHWKQAPAAVDTAVVEFGLEPIVDVLVQRLSGGQRRLAHLATSFVHRPPVRLLDEPTTALDFETRQRLIQLVRRWREEGVATVVTAHYPEDIEDLCTDLVLLRHGGVRPLGSLRAFLSERQRLRVVLEVNEQEIEHQFDVTDDSIGAVISALSSLQSSAGTRVVSLQLSTRTLRSILMQDPALEAYMEQAREG